MEYSETDFPQRQQVPVDFRRRVGDDAQARSFCPINGTLFDGQPRPVTEESRHIYQQRKDRERQRKANTGRYGAGDGGQATRLRKTTARGKKRPSLGGNPEARVLTPIPGTCHMWAVEDPSAASIAVNYQGSTTRAYTALNHSSSPPPSPLSTLEQLAESVPDHGDEIQLHFPYVARAHTARSTPDPSSVPINVSTNNNYPTTQDLEKYCEDPSTRSSQLPTARTEHSGMSAAPSSAYVPPSAPDSPCSAAQGSWWYDDRFIATYQSFWIPRSINSHDSSRPALAPGQIKSHPDTLEQVHGRPAAKDQASTVPVFTGKTTRRDTPERCSRDVPRPSRSDSSTHAQGNSFLDWSVPPAMVASTARIDREQQEQQKTLEMAASAGYAHTLALQASMVPSTVPDEAYAAMHASSPTVLSSHSELTHAFAGPLHAFADSSAPSKLATARRRKSSRPEAAWAPTSRQDRYAAPASSL